MDDLISRQAAIDALGERPMVWSNDDEYALGERNQYDIDRLAIETVPSIPKQRWIPIKVRPMDDEERKEWSERIGYDIEYEEAVMFDCPMPDDGQEVWVCSKCGNVWQDTCQIDEGIYLEVNGDWLDIVAWMPFNKPEPYREEGENQ